MTESLRCHAPETASRTEQPLLSVIVPAYNEARTIDQLIRRVLAAPYAKQLIIVDDGSTDQTAGVLEQWEGHAGVELLQHSRNRGKGAAIRTGLDYALGRFTIIQDADLEYDPEEYPALIEPMLRGESQVVYGSRYLRKGRPSVETAAWSGDHAETASHLRQSPSPPFDKLTAGRPSPVKGEGEVRGGGWVLRWGVSLLNVAVRVLYGARLSDEATCYKAFPTELLKSLDLRCERFEFCPEVTAKLCRLGLTIREVPIRYRARSQQAGKKIRWRDGATALWTLWKWRKWIPKK